MSETVLDKALLSNVCAIYVGDDAKQRGIEEFVTLFLLTDELLGAEYKLLAPA